MNILAGILIFLAAINFQTKSECLCAKLRKDEVVKRGWESVILAEKPVVKIIQGRVMDQTEDPMADAYVEVFNKKGRVDGCRVGKDGRFCFPNISKGKYELRVSQDGYNTTSIMVTVNTTSKNKENLKVVLGVSH